jgi:hypothetical protein
MSKIEDLMERIFTEVEKKDIKTTIALVEELSELVLHDKEAVAWLLQPINITKFHNSLTEHFGIPRKMFMLRNRVPSAHRRAVMFVKAISNGLRRADVA